MDETKLILDLQNNSSEAFRILYDSYAPRLYGFVFNLTKSSYLAKEIVQETFIKIWEKRSDLRTDASFKSYIFTIAKNHILNSFRNQLLINELISYDLQMNDLKISESNTEKQAELNDLVNYIEKIKQLLTPRQKQIFELSREKGLSIEEIAEALNISERTVKNQLHLSLQTLRSYIDRKAWLLLPLVYFFIYEK